MGGEAVADGENVADFAGAGRMVQRAIDTFGRLDTSSTTPASCATACSRTWKSREWDAVIAVHLKGTFSPTRHAAAYWRDQSKAGNPVAGRIVNTSSPSGVSATRGRPTTAPPKPASRRSRSSAVSSSAGTACCANAIAPVARTRMTENIGMGPAPEGVTFDALDPANISPMVVWLGSNENTDVTGRVFLVDGDRVSVAEGWRRGPTARNDKMRWEPSQLTKVIPDLVGQAEPNSTMFS